MMIGERHRLGPVAHVTPLTIPEELASETRYSFPLSGINEIANGGDCSPFHLQEVLAAFQRYLPPTNESEVDSDSELSGRESDAPVDAYSCDHFRMFEFKVRKCMRGRSHDWTECPYAHPGEKARRRDPRKFHYSATSCPDFRKGNCEKGDSCESAHGVFECWLHPARYRTQPCKDGINCRRRVCFFAHTPEQLRVLPQPSPRGLNSPDSYDESPFRQYIDGSCDSPVDSPPVSPMTRSLGRSLGPSCLNEMVASLRNMHLSKVKSLPSSWNGRVGCSGYPSQIRHGYWSLPTTPTRALERVESGRELRAKLVERLRKENSMVVNGYSSSPGICTPDVDWVTELVE